MYHTFSPGPDGESSTVEILHLKWESRRSRAPYLCEECRAVVNRVHVMYHSRCKACFKPGWYFGMAVLDHGMLGEPSGPYATEEGALMGALEGEAKYRADQVYFATLNKNRAEMKLGLG